MRITSKGQVTIPQAIREKSGLLPHTEVEFRISGKVVTMRRARKEQTRGEAIVARLRGTATRKMTTDEIMALTRGEE